MFPSAAILGFTLLAVAHGQQVGTYQTETHPKLSWQKCTKGGSCTTVQGSVVLDSNWRWTHVTSGYTNCYTGNEWNSTVCADNASCAKNCALEGADYTATYGITASGNSLTMKFVTKGQYATNIGSRVYLLDTDTKYYMFKPKGMEFTFDVDVSGLPCGLNGALYFSQMEADGGMGKYSGNKCGAKYGTGYCDAQCPHDMKFINGEANVEGWKPSDNDQNAGSGKYGTCCNEMDIWEGNVISTAYTPHSCSVNGQYRCSGTECGDSPDNRYGGVCDKDGCDFNSYRMGDTSFYGKGLTVDTSKKITVVTQFVTDTNTTSGTLSEIRRLYVQNGKVIQNSKVNIPGMSSFDSVTDSFCTQQKQAFGDQNSYKAKGGFAAMSKALDAGVVLVLSIWDDHTANMLWLDSAYPLDKDASTPGVARGTCDTSSGDPKDVEANSPNAQVIYSNIKFGDIGSTYSAR